MRLPSLEIPDDPADLAVWLERHLVGPDLAALVAELEAVNGQVVAEPMDRDQLRRDRDAILAGGLSILPPAALRQYLRRP